MNYEEKEAGERIVNRILKQLTPENIQKEVRTIQAIELPPDVQRWVEEYEKVGDRSDFIWKWTYSAVQKITLSSVTEEYKKSIWTTKTISTILNSLIDDLADKRKNKELLQKAVKICLYQDTTFLNDPVLEKTEKEYLQLIKRLWEVLNERLKKYPRYEQFKECFLYDYLQFLNSMHYSFLVNENPHSINLTECEMYTSHNIQGIISFTIDLMCSPAFNEEELGVLREIAWNAQRMGRIGNSVTTWEREVYENDFTSEVFAYLLSEKLMSVNDLINGKEKEIIDEIKKIDVQGYFFKRWSECYQRTSILGQKVNSVNIGKLLSGLSDLINMHFISKGLK